MMPDEVLRELGRMEREAQTETEPREPAHDDDDLLVPLSLELEARIAADALAAVESKPLASVLPFRLVALLAAAMPTLAQAIRLTKANTHTFLNNTNFFMAHLLIVHLKMTLA
jgi:hypothetical protein